MHRKILLIISLIILVFAGFAATIYFKNKTNKTEVNGIILFYSDICTHCQALEQWIESKNISDSIKFTRLEVSKDQNNQKILIEKATFCEISTNEIGVPFLWTGETCVIGDEPIENFFEQKIKSN